MPLLKEDGVESVYLLLKVINVKKGRLGPRNLIWKLTMLLGKIIGRAYPTEPIFLVLFNKPDPKKSLIIKKFGYFFISFFTLGSVFIKWKVGQDPT